MSSFVSIVAALVAALGMALMAFRGERAKRTDAESKAAALTDVMAEHSKALSKLEKSRIEIEDAEDEPEKIAGLWNKWMKKRGE